jgi:hypothetical protein
MPLLGDHGARSSGAAFTLAAATEPVRRLRQHIEPLAGLYLAAVEHELGMRRAASGMTRYAFDRLSSLWDSLTLVVSDDSSEFDSDCGIVNPAGGMAVPLATARAPEYDEEFIVNLLGSVEVGALESLRRISRTGATVDGRAAFVQVRNDDLTLGGFDVLQLRHALRLENRGLRRLYPR